MAADNNESPEKKQSIGADLIIPICAVVFTLYYISTILDSPWTAKVTAYLIGSVLIGLCFLLFVRSGYAVRRGRADLSFKSLIEPVEALPRRLALFGLTLAYIVFLPIVGFTLTTFVFLSAGMLLLSRGEGRRFKFILAGCLSVGWFALLVVGFKRRFPLGWVDEQLKVGISDLYGFLEGLFSASGGV